MSYIIARGLLRFVLAFFGRIRAFDIDNVPDEGGVLICANHISYIDPPAVGCPLKRRVHFMAKAELFRMPVLGPMITSYGAFPVHRGTADRQALRQAIDLLRGGNIVAMFPEGKRSLDGNLLPAEAGVGMIARNAGVPVVPAALINTNKLLRPHTWWLAFTHVKVVYGKPLDLSDLDQMSSREAYDEVGTRVMRAIADLLKQHGDGPLDYKHTDP